jgi:hypothetical protein
MDVDVNEKISAPNVTLYHATSKDNLTSIGTYGFCVNRSGKGGFTEQACAISGDKETESGRQDTSANRIHFGNYNMVENYFNLFKFQPEIDKIYKEVHDEKMNELRKENPKSRTFQLKPIAHTHATNHITVVKARDKAQEFIKKNVVLVIHEKFSEHAYYDRDPDESGSLGIRSIRKCKDVSPENIFLLMGDEKEIGLTTYIKSPEKYTLFNPGTQTTQYRQKHEEDDELLEMFCRQFS